MGEVLTGFCVAGAGVFSACLIAAILPADTDLDVTGLAATTGPPRDVLAVPNIVDTIPVDCGAVD